MAWSFSSTAFDIYDGSSIFDEWFTREQIVTIDPALGGQRRTVDLGGISYQPLSVTAQVTSKATRDALVALLGSSATLTDDDGRSCTALLVAATPIRVMSPTSGRYRAKLTFEFIQ
jgi:hypothetical protein